MTTSALPHRRPCPRHAGIAGAFGGVVLVSVAVAVAGVGVAAAETAAEILTRECTSYEPNPDLFSSPPRVSDCHGANLIDADLTGANLTWANLTGAILAGAVLSGADVAGATLTDSTLTGATLINTTLTDTTLTDSDLSDSDLTGADLTDANLFGVRLVDADLTGANLSGANLTRANLNGANLTGTSAVPADIAVVAETVDGAPVTWSAPTMPTGLTFGTCAPASGTVFPVGATAVSCTVSSLWGGNVTTGSGTVIVTVAPVIDPPATGSSGSLDSIFGFGS
ncbi:pentapeptide repeat-containing protein [Rhodococcus sp. 24CO]|uniref:pentapeptide repeat-containing protein n=1 Tax=Rhodococcus sp. 24CO TaxID=3117460 RepID=UPI003D3259D3